MKHKIFTFLLAVMASVGMSFAETYSGSCGENLTWSLNTEDSVLTISGTGAMTYPSTQLPWHSKKEYIKSVVIENGVTSIASCAFYADYSALTSVTIPNSVTNIGALAFAACTSLSSIEIPNSVTDIGQLAFYDCSSLKSVIIPNSVTNIGYGPFIGCIGLTSLTVETDNTNYCSLDGVMFSKDKTVLIQCPGGKQGAYMIPNGVANIALTAFEKCSSLTSIEIPNTVTNIGNEAFAGCTSLLSVTIPSSVVSIGENVFKYCSYLTSIDVASDNPNYSSIDGVLFNKEKTTLLRCPNGNTRTEYTIPNSVATIGPRSFESCWQLNKVIIPDGVTTIEANAFEGCVNLTSVSIANSVFTIGNEAFLGCQKLTSVINYAATPQTIASTAFSFANQSACTLYVPAESIEAYKAADVWNEFTNILPIEETEGINYTTLADIYNMAADSAFTLGAFDVVYVPSFQNGSNMYIKDSTGACVIYKVNYGLQAGDHVEAGLQGKVSIYNGSHQIVPVSTKEELTITSGETPAPIVATEVPSLNNVSQYVVYEGVSFATDTAFVEGRRHAVNGIWNGETITFYNQYYIGATLAAGKTYNITAVNTIYQTTPQAYPLAVEEASSDTPEPCVLASGTCGAQGANLTWTLSCDSVLTISGTKMWDLGNDIEHAPWYDYRSAVKSVIIEEGVATIGYFAFQDCNNLTSIPIPSSIKCIYGGAFMGCNMLSAIYISDLKAWCAIEFNNDNPLIYGHNLYLNKELVTDLVIPNNVTSINNSAFAGCTSLLSVTIPSSVVSIGENVFKYCSYLTSIDVASDNPNYSSIDGVLFNKEQATLLRCPNGNTRTEYTIPNSVAIIGPRSFESCWQLNKVIIPDGVTTIEANAFEGCVNLTSLSIANSVSAIGNEAFLGCQKLTSVINYAATPQTIASTAFSFANQSACTLYVPAESIELYKATDVWKDFRNILPIGDFVETDYITVSQALEIGAGLEVGATTDKQYTIRGYVSAITTPFSEQSGNQTFYIADDSLSIAMSNAEGGFYVYRGKPAAGTAIREGALVELTTAIKNYRGVYIENAEQNVLVTVIKEGPECRTLTGICGDNLTWTLNTCDSVLTISGTGAMYNYTKQNVAPWTYLGVKSVVIGNGVTTLGTFAFYQCAMSSISIPASVTKVHFNTFNNSYNLMNFTVDSANPVYSSLDGVLFNKDRTIIVRYPRGRQGEYAIPSGVVIVGDGAFNGCYNVTGVSIPNSVTTLGMAAFFACGMAEITIPENVNRIDSLAFIGCQYLNVVTDYAIEPQVIDTNVFGGVIDISACTLYVPAQSLAAYQSADVWKKFGTILPISAATVTEPVSDVTVEPYDNTATVTWPTPANAAVYTLEISKDGVVICRLTFNANGILTGIAYAPGRDGAHHAPAAVMTANGLQFTVTGLESNTHYSYSVTVRDSDNKTLASYSGTFTTTGESITTALDNATPDSMMEKIILNGQLLIIRNGRTYNAQGTRIE